MTFQTRNISEGISEASGKFLSDNRTVWLCIFRHGNWGSLKAIGGSDGHSFAVSRGAEVFNGSVGLLNQHVWLLILGTGWDYTYNLEGVGHAGGRTQTSQPPFILEARCNDCAYLQFTIGIV